MSDLNRIVVKQAPKYNLLCSTQSVSISQIPEIAGTVTPLLYHFATQNQIMIAGPCMFLYDGEFADENSIIDLTIAIPIATNTLNVQLPENIQLKEYPAVDVVSYEHPGSLKTLCDSYAKLTEDAKAANLDIACTKCREIYTHWIDVDSPENRTELQYPLND